MSDKVRQNPVIDETFLANLPIFEQLQADELRDLFVRLKRRTYRPNETIFHKDDAGSTMYIIIDGTVKVSVPSEIGTEVILAMLTRGDIFGELSMFDGKPRSATMTANNQTDVFVFHRDEFLDYVTKHPRLALGIITALSNRLRNTDHLVEDVVFLDIPARLAKRLLDLSRTHGQPKEGGGIEIGMKLTQQDIAYMLGTTRESVNRQLVAFQERGFISIERGRITILKSAELEKRATNSMY